MADQPRKTTEATSFDLELLINTLARNPTGEPATPSRLRLHQVINLSQASFHQFILELQSSIRNKQHQEWLAMVRPVYDSCMRTRKFLNRIFALYYTLPCDGPSLASDSTSLFRFLWNLNFSARQALLPGQQGLDPTSYNAIGLPLACLNIILASTPLTSPSLRKPFSDQAHFPYRATIGGEKSAADTLQCLVASSPPYISAAFPSSTPTEKRDLAQHVYHAAAKLTQAVDAFLAEILAPVGLHPVGAEELYSNQEHYHQDQQPSATSIPVLTPASDIPISGCRMYIGLIDAHGNVSERAMHALNTYIDQVVCPNVEIDERVFIEEDVKDKLGEQDRRERKRREVLCQPVQEPTHLRGFQEEIKGQQRHQAHNMDVLEAVIPGNTIQTPPHPTQATKWQHPLPSEGAPMAAAVVVAAAASTGQTLQWLRNIASTIDIQSLCEDLKLIGVSETTMATVATSATSMLNTAVWPPSAAEYPRNLVEENNESSSRLRDLTLSLFYCTLKLLLQTEISSSLHGGDAAGSSSASRTRVLLDKIASNPLLIQCLMALSLECVVFSAKLPQFDFPASLKLSHNASAFDVARLLPRFFLAHQTTMPEGLKTHLLSIEERILEKYAWEDGSSLFDMLREATILIKMESNIEDQEREHHSLFPRKLGSASISSTSSTATSKAVQAHNLLSAFIDKAVKLATVRLNKLFFSSTGLLQTQPTAATTTNTATTAGINHLLLQAVTAVDEILREHTWLLYGRHLDQIIICVLYAVLKNTNPKGTASGGADAGVGQGGGNTQVVAEMFSGGFRGIIEAYIRCFGTDSVSQVNTLWINQYLGKSDIASSGATQGPASPCFTPQQQQKQHPNHQHQTQQQQQQQQQIHQEQTQQRPSTMHIIQFYNTVFLPETHTLLQSLISGSFPLLPNLPSVPMKPSITVQTVLPDLNQSVPPGISPWSRQNNRLLFSPFSSSSPSYAMKLSPGRWKVSTAGTRRIEATAPNLDVEKEAEVTWQEEEVILGVERKRRKREKRTSGGTSTAVVGTPAKGACRPVDALLAVAADAEEELRRSTPSSSDTGSGER